MGFPIPGLRTEKNPFGWNVTEKVHVNHLAPDLTLPEGGLNVMPLAGGRGGMLSLSAIENESGRITKANLTDEVGREEGTVAKPTIDIQFPRLMPRVRGPIPILPVGDLGADVSACGGSG